MEGLASRGVVGAIIFAIVMILVVPVAIMFAGAIWSALFGWFSCESLFAEKETTAEQEGADA
jgi:hypothetical protein